MQISDPDNVNEVGQTRGSVTAMYLSIEMLRCKRERTKCYITTGVETAGASSKAPAALHEPDHAEGYPREPHSEIRIGLKDIGKFQLPGIEDGHHLQEVPTTANPTLKPMTLLEITKGPGDQDFSQNSLRLFQRMSVHECCCVGVHLDTRFECSSMA